MCMCNVYTFIETSYSILFIPISRLFISVNIKTGESSLTTGFPIIDNRDNGLMSSYEEGCRRRGEIRYTGLKT